MTESMKMLYLTVDSEMPALAFGPYRGDLAEITSRAAIRLNCDSIQFVDYCYVDYNQQFLDEVVFVPLATAEVE